MNEQNEVIKKIEAIDTGADNVPEAIDTGADNVPEAIDTDADNAPKAIDAQLPPPVATRPVNVLHHGTRLTGKALKNAIRRAAQKEKRRAAQKLRERME